MKVIISKNVINGEVLEILEDLKSRNYELDQLALRVRDYVRRFNKCGKGKSLVEELVNKGLKEITAVIIANIVPKSIDEVRVLTTFEPESPSEETLNEILELVNNYCS